jgi:ParB family transcriptional regulator, chromosome partitioning protein
VSSAGLVKAFEEDTERKRLMVKRTQATRNQLLFVTEALLQLSTDDAVMTLLENEELASLPARITARVESFPVGAP